MNEENKNKMQNNLTDKDIENLNKWAEEHNIEKLKINDKEKIFNLEELVIIDRGSIELPKEIGNLTNLKLLYIEDCENLKLPKEIEKLTNLKTFSIKIINRMQDIPADIFKLINLEFLQIRCNDLIELPEDIKNLVNLKILDISNAELPKEIGNLTNLKGFIISGENLKLPKEIGDLINLESLDIYGKNLELPKEIGNLTNLKGFRISGENLKLPKEIEKLINLKSLNINISKTEHNLPEISKLINLEELNINCESLKRLPEDIKNLVNLKRFYIYNTELPKEIGNLINLEKFDICGVNDLMELPKEIGNLTNLKQLMIAGNNLKLPKEIGNLSNLESLDILCDSLESFPNEIENMTNLVLLKIVYHVALNFKILPMKELKNLTNLKHIEVHHIFHSKDRDKIKNYLTEREIENLNKWAKKYNIEDLKIKDKEKILSISIRNDKIEYIPTEIFKLTKLEKLDISCKNLMELSDNIKYLSNLKELYIYCENLESLPDGIEKLINLESVNIIYNLNKNKKINKRRLQYKLENNILNYYLHRISYYESISSPLLEKGNYLSTGGFANIYSDKLYDIVAKKDEKAFNRYLEEKNSIFKRIPKLWRFLNFKKGDLILVSNPYGKNLSVYKIVGDKFVGNEDKELLVTLAELKLNNLEDGKYILGFFWKVEPVNLNIFMRKFMYVMLTIKDYIFSKKLSRYIDDIINPEYLFRYKQDGDFSLNKILDLNKLGKELENQLKKIFDFKFEKELLNALRKLPKNERNVLILYLYCNPNNLTLKEIGKVLKISERKVEKIYKKAMQDLIRIME